MTSTYSTTLGTVFFVAAAESWAEQSGSEVNVLGFPGGDAIAISISGQRETTRTFKALLDNVTDYKALRAMRARAGQLRVDNWDATPVNAILKQIAPDPIATDGQIAAQVQFVLY